ncbi:hypothetical protein IQ07DRAFT_420270 [Pyrenochaeta sp. DS3sAY3a]|nr:hypothetical protein IQ07DRAFT_420270 [Pyrenochaeta sp. DS3sAY3a]
MSSRQPRPCSESILGRTRYKCLQDSSKVELPSTAIIQIYQILSTLFTERIQAPPTRTTYSNQVGFTMFEHATVTYCYNERHKVKKELQDIREQECLTQCLLQYIKVDEIDGREISYPSFDEMKLVWTYFTNALDLWQDRKVYYTKEWAVPLWQRIVDIKNEYNYPWDYKINTIPGKRWAIALMEVAIEMPLDSSKFAETEEQRADSLEERARSREVIIREALRGVWSDWENDFERLWTKALHGEDISEDDWEYSTEDDSKDSTEGDAQGPAEPVA